MLLASVVGAEPLATVIAVRGTARGGPGPGQLRALRPGATLARLSRVMTSAGSRVDLALPGGRILILDGAAQVKLISVLQRTAVIQQIYGTVAAKASPSASVMLMAEPADRPGTISACEIFGSGVVIYDPQTEILDVSVGSGSAVLNSPTEQTRTIDAGARLRVASSGEFLADPRRAPPTPRHDEAATTAALTAALTRKTPPPVRRRDGPVRVAPVQVPSKPRGPVPSKEQPNVGIDFRRVPEGPTLMSYDQKKWTPKSMFFLTGVAGASGPRSCRQACEQDDRCRLWAFHPTKVLRSGRTEPAQCAIASGDFPTAPVPGGVVGALSREVRSRPPLPEAPIRTGYVARSATYPKLTSMGGGPVATFRQVACTSKPCSPQECRATCVGNPHCEGWMRTGARFVPIPGSMGVEHPPACIQVYDLEAIQPKRSSSSDPRYQNYAGRVR